MCKLTTCNNTCTHYYSCISVRYCTVVLVSIDISDKTLHVAHSAQWIFNVCKYILIIIAWQTMQTFRNPRAEWIFSYHYTCIWNKQPVTLFIPIKSHSFAVSLTVLKSRSHADYAISHAFQLKQNLLKQILCWYMY